MLRASLQKVYVSPKNDTNLSKLGYTSLIVLLTPAVS